ncbi:response regulator [bacterium]|nr:response regulator [bacterium]
MSARVLLIEDEAEIADFIVRGLKEEGFSVELAREGVDAWHRLSTEAWDLILLDWWLPGYDGLELLRRFRASGQTTKVMFLTARDAVEERVRGLDAGADDYLCKPFAFEEMLARVRSLTRRSDGRTSSIIRYGDIVIDLASQKVERAGQKIELTGREFALLAFFMRRPGEVLSRTRIYEQVWDQRYDGLSNTLEVHVMELRRKLEALGPRLIKTVRGHGYVLEGEKIDDGE